MRLSVRGRTSLVAATVAAASSAVACIVVSPAPPSWPLVEQLMVVAGAAIAAALMGWLITGFLLRPLGRITRDVEAIASGELGRPIEPPGDAELGTLAQAVDSISDLLMRSLDRLQLELGVNEELNRRLNGSVPDQSDTDPTDGSTGKTLARGVADRSEMEALLRSSQLRLSDMISFLPDATLVIDATGRVIAWNHAMELLTGVGAQRVLGTDYETYSLPFYGSATPLLANALLEGDQVPDRYTSVQRHDSTVTAEAFAPMLGDYGSHLSVTARVLVDSNGHVAGAIESIRDITAGKLAGEALKESEERMRAVFQNPAVGATLMTGSGEYVQVNERWAEMLAYEPDELIGRNLIDVTHPDDIATDYEQIEKLLEGQVDTYRIEKRYIRKDGGVVWTDTSISALRDDHGHPRNLIGIMADITDRKKAEDDLRALSMRDGLTGLPNRRAFEERLEDEWRRSLRTGDPLSLLMVDVDRFKEYNDVNGHIAGDECLKALGNLLEDTFQRATDFAARWGGEEFAVVLGSTEEDEAAKGAERLRAAMEEMGVRRHPQHAGVVTVSVGVATARPELGHTPDSLVRAADDALYASKRAGRNRVSVGSLEN